MVNKKVTSYILAVVEDEEQGTIFLTVGQQDKKGKIQIINAITEIKEEVIDTVINIEKVIKFLEEEK